MGTDGAGAADPCELSPRATTGRRAAQVVAALTALVCAALATLILCDGIIPFGDAVSYWSGVRETAAGRPLTTRLLSPFTGFPLVDFLAEGGRAPFTAYAVGHPVLVGLVAVPVGADAAMIMVTILATGAIGWWVVRGPVVRATRQSATVLGIRAMLVIGVLMMPIGQTLIRSALPEVPFTLTAIGASVELVRSRDDDRSATRAALWAALAGLLRFQGIAIGIVVVLVLVRRRRTIRSAITSSFVALCAPLVALVWASVVGQGRRTSWYGLSVSDVEFGVTSIARWFTSDGAPGLDVVARSGWQVPWWAVTVAAAWVVFGAVATWSWWKGGPLPPRVHLPMLVVTAQGLLVLGTILVLDDLTTFEPRILWPLAVLTLTSLGWWVDDLPRRQGIALLAVVALWAALAAPPTRWSIGGKYEGTAVSEIATEIGAELVVTNAADALHFETGLPAAYFPVAIDAQTGISRDTSDDYAALPCALAESGGIAAVDLSGFVDAGTIIRSLRIEVRNGHLDAERMGDVVLFRPTVDPTECR